jgi:hypothetical protein
MQAGRSGEAEEVSPRAAWRAFALTAEWGSD